MKRKEKKPAIAGFLVYGALDKIRTCDRLVRSQVLYPTELRARCPIGWAVEVAYIMD
jgi:hypothetical protein